MLAPDWKDQLRKTMIDLGIVSEGESLTGAITINCNNGKISDLVKPVRFK